MNELIPSNWTPLERAMAHEAHGIAGLPVVVKEVWSPWECPADVLPWLGWALHVDDWSNLKTEQEKRKAIAESIFIHQRKGTAAAVRRALQAAGYEVEIDEATGQPYTFRLVLDVSKGGVENSDYDAALAITMENKNVRSHLLGVSALLRGVEPVFVAAAELSGEITSILPPARAVFETVKKIFFGGATHDVDSITISPPTPRDATLSAPVYAAGYLDIDLTYA